MWAWGNNDRGQLGDGTTTDKSTPTQESTGATNWSAIAVGWGHSVALKSDGTLWAWGYNFHGQLGDGTTADKSTPVQEPTGAANWAAIAAGYHFTVAIKGDGTLWAWGRNVYGALGDGTAGVLGQDSNSANKDTPTQESTGATNWATIAAGEFHTVALKSDGTLWAWGANFEGQLGDGTFVGKSTPTQELTGAANWSAIAAGQGHTVALKSDGTLWAWGFNYRGQLGDGHTPPPNQSIIHKSTPAQEITGATNWSAIAAGGDHTIALKSDGTLWAWAYNNVGQLGDGTTTDTTTPNQESTAATTWSAITAGVVYTVALKSDDHLPTPTPIPVPSLTQWGLMGMAGAIAAIFLWQRRRARRRELV